MYQYKFNGDDCWYKTVCPKYNTDSCGPACIRYMEMDYLMENSGIPKNRQIPVSLIPSKVDLKAFYELQGIKNGVVNFSREGLNLYIYSHNFGNGKTSWAIKILLKFFDDVWAGNGFKSRGIFIHVPTFLTKIKEGISTNDEDFNNLRKILLLVDLVVWDDIASVKLSDFDHTNLLTYIDQRILANLSNIYTGNLAENELYEALGNRLASRVWNNSKIIKLVGEDRRGNK